MLRIAILKVEDPSCFWGRVVQGLGGDSTTTEQYDRLQAQLNLFYSDVMQDLRVLRPTLLEKGQVCVVYWSVMKSWCRAVVESVIVDSVSCRAHCLLVDHGELLLVPTEQIRVAMQNFLQLPFWVRRFHLAGIKPTTLRVTVYEDKAELIPSSQWDSSATVYLHNLLQASTRTEAVLLKSESGSTAVELYLTVRNIKICMNDELVAKKFAFYIRGPADGGGQGAVDDLLVMLPSSNLTQTNCTTSERTTAQTRPDVTSCSVMSHSLATAGACDWLTAPSTPQSQQHELKTSEEGCRSKVTEEPSPRSQSQNVSDAVAAEGDSSEDTDSSLAAAPTKNLSLFRFLKFLNRGSSSQPVAPSVTQHEELEDDRPEETTAASSTFTVDQTGAECLGGSRVEQVEDLTDEETSSLSRSAEWRSEEDWACSRLLEWLNPEPVNPEPVNPEPVNPEPVNPDPEAADDVVVPTDPSGSGILVHSALPMEPCTNLDDAPLTSALRWVLQRRQSNALSPADRHSWPAVARGCNTVIVSPAADRPLSYLAPLLTHILLNSVFTSLTSSTGPIAVLLCPGWEKAQAVYELLEEMRVTQFLHPIIVLLGVDKDKAKAVKIPKGCLLLVTTPFSLVRLLSCHCFQFLRLYHLVLDEADQLFALAPEQMAAILQHFQKVTSSDERASCPQQVVVVSKRWTNHMEGLLANHMPYPCIVVTVPEEAALYGNVQQIILVTLESNKISALLGALDFNPDVGQKTLIVANSAQEVEDVNKAVSNKSAFCLKMHEELTEQIDPVVQQWRKDIGAGTHVVLVTTTECLKCLGIRDATCVVHYSFPTSPKVFGSRLFCMAENFRDLSKPGQMESSPHLPKSVLLISERNARHVVGVLRYLVRTRAPLPPELLSFARGVHMAQEDQKTDRPLCSYLKSFGVCRDSSACPDRHRLISHLDESVLPATGVIEVVPLHVKTPSVFDGRIVGKGGGGFQSMESEMTSYYANRKPGAKEVLEGGLYAVQEGEVFHRVKVLSVPDRGDRLFFSICVRFVDVGKEEEVKSHQLLQLPEQFHSLPGQAVEIIVCKVKPADAEINWHPKVTRTISQKIRGVQHRARAVFSLGNTVFVDPMVRVTQVPGMKTVINEYNVQSEILNTGMGVCNPEHLNLLKALSQESETGSDKDASHLSGLGGGTESLEVRIKAEEEVLAEAFRPAEQRSAEVSRPADPPHVEPDQSQSPVSSKMQSLVSTASAAEHHLVPGCDQRSWPGAEQVMRNREEEHWPSTVRTAAPDCCENGGDLNNNNNKQHIISVKETDGRDATRSFHPQVRWHQASDAVFVTVKLTNPQSQRCDFYPDRVVYSGIVDSRTYRAELELQGDIAADRCCWEMKSNEPVLKLVKQQQGHWERLLRKKNIFVSYDVEHMEEDEDRTPNGLCFEEGTGEENCYVNCVSSDSD